MIVCTQNQNAFSDVRQVPNVSKNNLTVFSILKLCEDGLCFSLFFSVVLFCFSFAAHSKDIAICGEASGYVYTTQNMSEDPRFLGWHGHAIENGKIQLVRSEEGSLDILSSGIAGLSSALGDGAKVTLDAVSDDSISVSVKYPNNDVLEGYIFYRLEPENLHVMWTQSVTQNSKQNSSPRLAAFAAKCSYLNLDELRK